MDITQEMVTVVALVTSVFLCNVSAALTGKGLQSLSCLNQTMKAVQGDNVTLQCFLVPSINLTGSTFDVTRNDVPRRGNFVYLYRHAEYEDASQMEQYKHRTTLNHKDLSRGIVTLRIFSVNQSDSGEYKVYFPKLKARFTVNLTVGVKDQQNNVKWNVSNTTGPPGAQPDIPGADSKKRAHYIAIALVVVLILGIGVLVIGGKIKLRGRRQAEADTKTANGTELKPLRTRPKPDLKDLEDSAAHG